MQPEPWTGYAVTVKFNDLARPNLVFDHGQVRHLPNGDWEIRWSVPKSQAPNLASGPFELHVRRHGVLIQKDVVPTKMDFNHEWPLLLFVRRHGDPDKAPAMRT